MASVKEMGLVNAAAVRRVRAWATCRLDVLAEETSPACAPQLALHDELWWDDGSMYGQQPVLSGCGEETYYTKVGRTHTHHLAAPSGCTIVACIRAPRPGSTAIWTPPPP